MREIKISADKLSEKLLRLDEEFGVCILDSCGIARGGSPKLIAGIKPLETFEITSEDAFQSLKILDEIILRQHAVIFTISYDFGLKLNNINPRKKDSDSFPEPDIFAAVFDSLIIHDYKTGKTFLHGNAKIFDEIEEILSKEKHTCENNESENYKVSSNFTAGEYGAAVNEVKEYILRGETYQANLTRQIKIESWKKIPVENIFLNLRRNQPAPFAAFLRRANDVVISASPERFFKIFFDAKTGERRILVSPIKGTRPRGKTPEEDFALRSELLGSEKDRAENIMIADLMRNDIGRICKYGSVNAEKLCDLEEYKTLFHLVSDISGTLRDNVNFSDILKAVFPCGSITGAPKIRTMQIIDFLEPVSRGLSTGAIGYKDFDGNTDAGVAIRTMNVRFDKAIFNVGGGITIDSNPQEEYEETNVKLRALFSALGLPIISDED